MLNDSINFLHAVPPTVGFSEGYALLCQFFVIGFGYGVVNGRKPLLRVRGQVRVGCKDVAHGVGTGCHGRFAHCQIFVNFQRVVAIGDVVYYLWVYANVIGGNICRQFTCFFCPRKWTFFSVWIRCWRNPLSSGPVNTKLYSGRCLIIS